MPDRLGPGDQCAIAGNLVVLDRLRGPDDGGIKHLLVRHLARDPERDRARAAGFSAFVEAVPTDKGTLNRVRVGPVASRAEADALKAQLSSKLGVSGIVRPHP